MYSILNIMMDIISIIENIDLTDSGRLKVSSITSSTFKVISIIMVLSNRLLILFFW